MMPRNSVRPQNTKNTTEKLFGAKKFLAMRMRERTHLDATPIAKMFVESVAVETPSNTVVTVFTSQEDQRQ